MAAMDHDSLSPKAEDSFYYFAYGSCMCPVDLKRSLGESTHAYVIGPATLPDYRLGFFRRSERRNCGVLDVVQDPKQVVHGVLYRLPLRLSDRLDEREVGYGHETVSVNCGDRRYNQVRTYTVMEKLSREIAPNDWYFNVVLRGAYTCGLPEQYCWQLFHHMHQLQEGQRQPSWPQTCPEVTARRFEVMPIPPQVLPVRQAS